MMPVMVPENERLVLDGMAFARMQSAILLFVFQRRAEADLVRFEVVPNGEAVAVARPEAGAAEPDFFPFSDEVAMSKIPLRAVSDGFADVRPEDEAGDDRRPPLEPEDAPCPARVWAMRAQQASMQKKAVSAMRILIVPILSGVDVSSAGRTRGRLSLIIKVPRERGKASRFSEKT
jgi:hypothetical protein